MPFSVDGVQHLEGQTCLPEEFFRALTEDAEVSTSQPSPGEIIRLWERLLQDHEAVLHFPMPVYRTLPHAEITCLDYSADMMEQARRRTAGAGLSNVRFQQGDVGALPFMDNSFDLVLSLNGFHAFPDKEAAYRETLRVLKPGGVFCGCFYVRGETRRTDRWVQRFYVPKGFFTPPFETADSLEKRLGSLYAEFTVQTVNSMGYWKQFYNSLHRTGQRSYGEINACQKPN